jgi:hypothetical protein
MASSFHCPSCQALLLLEEEHLGRKVRCSECQKVFLAGEETSAPSAPPEPAVVELARPVDDEPSAGAIQVEPMRSRPATPTETSDSPPVEAERSGKAGRRPDPRRPRASASSSSTHLMVAVLLGGVLLGIGLSAGAGIFAYLRLWPAALPQNVARTQAREDRLAAQPERPAAEPGDQPGKRADQGGNDVPGAGDRNEPGPAAPAKSGPLTLKPARLEADKVTRPLPDTIDDLVVGGGGRFLLFSMRKQKKVGLFDANEGKVVHYFPAAESEVKIAAGLTKLIMAFPRTNTIQRWDLITREKELTVPLPDVGKLEMALMGSASRGPVLVTGFSKFPPPRGYNIVFLDLATLKELNVTNLGRAIRGFTPGFTRVSADGTVFGTWAPNTSPQGLQSFVLAGTDIKSYYQHKSLGHVIPGPDGKILYTACGVYSQDGQPIGKSAENIEDYVLPAVQGDFYLRVQMAGQRGGKPPVNPPAGDGNKNTLSLHAVGDSRPLVQFDDVIDPGNGPIPSINRWDRETFGNDKRFLFIPGADLLVTVPLSNDRLELRRVSLDTILEKAGRDYLFVQSRAPAAVQRGTTLVYQVAVKSKKGGLKYKLDRGPAGMEVSKDGTVVWKVDSNHPLGEESVRLTVSDSAGQETIHSFKLRVVADPVPGLAKGFDPRRGAPPESGSIRPGKVGAARVERPLPGSLGDICAGGGRFLLLTIPTQRKVAVFDANEGRIAGYIPLAGDNACIAAGREHLVVAFPDTGILQRWNLARREKELTVKSPFPHTIETLTMGHDSNGPIMVNFKSGGPLGDSGIQFLDLKLEAVTIDLKGRTGRVCYPHASADGTLFGFRDCVGAEPHSVGVIQLSGKTGTVQAVSIGSSTLVPSPDGRFIYTGGGVYTPEMKLVFPDREQTSFARPFLPALHGPYFMRLDFKQWDQHGGSVALFFQGHYTPFATLDNIDGVANEMIAYGRNRDSLTCSRRLFLIPGANLLVSVPKTNDRLVLHQVDMNELLEKSAIDYLLVTSRPPGQVARGGQLVYKLDIRSKKGGVKLSLDSGPKGMAISPSGELTWTVPADHPLGEENIIVTIRDAAGQETFHTFRLRVQAAAGEEKR